MESDQWIRQRHASERVAKEYALKEGIARIYKATIAETNDSEGVVRKTMLGGVEALCWETTLTTLVTECIRVGKRGIVKEVIFARTKTKIRSKIEWINIKTN